MKLDKLKRTGKPGFLDGQLLIAMPAMPDERFRRTVIYMCAHSEEGAMGLVVNRPAPKLTFPDLLVQLDVLSRDQAIRLPQHVANTAVLAGGPVEPGRGFVLHSTDYAIENSTLPVSGQIGLTITVEILKAIAHGNGPDQAVLALGYASWAPGQLESELQSNSWLHAPASANLIFGMMPHELKYASALRQIGVDPVYLSPEAGHS
ncbi:COG1678 Putative transcriptional regulator [Rhabdaerophilaceae bacterium]